MTISIDKILDAITENTRIVVLLNPNNPIGNVYTEDELEKVIEKTKKVGAIVIIDEAYHYFYPNTFLKYALNEENVVLLRTFKVVFDCCMSSWRCNQQSSDYSLCEKCEADI